MEYEIVKHIEKELLKIRRGYQKAFAVALIIWIIVIIYIVV